MLRAYLTQVRKTHGVPPRSRNSTSGAHVETVRKPPTWRTLTWRIVRRAEKLSGEEQADVQCAREAHTDSTAAVTLAQDFAALVRECRVTGLETWLERASVSTLVSFRAFATGIRQDEVAVRAALSVFVKRNGVLPRFP